MIEKKRSVGVTIFSVIFLLSGLIGLVSGNATSTNLVSYVQQNYHSVYKVAIKKIDELKNKEFEIADKQKLSNFRKDLYTAERDLEEFRQKYMIQQSMAPLGRLAFYFLLTCSILYIVSGVLALRLYPFGRYLIFSTAGLSLISKFYVLWFAFYTLKPVEIIVKDMFNLISYFFDFQVPFKIFPYPWQLFSETPLARNILLGYCILFLVYVFFIFYFFTRPKVKEQFR